MRRSDLWLALFISSAVHAAVLVQVPAASSVSGRDGVEAVSTKFAVALLARPSKPAPQSRVRPVTPAAAPDRSLLEAKSQPRPRPRVLPAVSAAPPVEVSAPAPMEPATTVSPQPQPIAAVEDPETQGSNAVSASASELQSAASPPLDSIRPVYPWRARKLGQEGRVLVQVSYDALGRLVDLQLARSSGYSLLDREALGAVRRSPPRGRKALEEIEVIFELEGAKGD